MQTRLKADRTGHPLLLYTVPGRCSRGLLWAALAMRVSALSEMLVRRARQHLHCCPLLGARQPRRVVGRWEHARAGGDGSVAGRVSGNRRAQLEGTGPTRSSRRTVARRNLRLRGRGPSSLPRHARPGLAPRVARRRMVRRTLSSWQQLQRS